MLWMFVLLGAAYHGIASLPVRDLLALSVALAASYVAATTVNDIADAEIDRVNHPRGRGRPLVQGTASPRDLWVLNVAAAVVALAAGAVVGWRGLVVVVVSLSIGYAYSVRPMLLSYRPYSATPVLALFALFMARIVLKDFRDRTGDEVFGRRTFLLRHGKRATCVVSAAALMLGTSLLMVALRPSPPLDAVLLACSSAVGFQLHRLARVDDARSEQVAIGLAARMGNGLLVTVLAWLLLQAQRADAEATGLLIGLLLAAFGGSFLVLARRPDLVLIGYKG